MTALDTPPDASRGPAPERAPDGLDERLGRHLDDLTATLPPGPDAAALAAALDGALTGGKRFRPRLVAEVHRALSPDGAGSQEPVVAVAAGVELLHTAFVVHDDVIDGDDVRRGAPTVPARFRRGALAEGGDHRTVTTRAVAGGVLTGDLALVLAMRAFAEAPVGVSVRARLLALVTEAIAVSAVGELADVRLATTHARTSTQDVLALAERKTAWYSFSLPMRLGAVLAGADDATVAVLGEAGLLLGTAFQLHDDLAGTFGEAAQTGKSTIADLREGKATLLIAHARTTPWWPLLAAFWGDPDLTESAAVVARGLLERSGSRRYVERVAADHLEAGLARLRGAGVVLESIVGMADGPDAGRAGAA